MLRGLAMALAGVLLVGLTSLLPGGFTDLGILSVGVLLLVRGVFDVCLSLPRRPRTYSAAQLDRWSDRTMVFNIDWLEDYAIARAKHLYVTGKIDRSQLERYQAKIWEHYREQEGI